MIDIGSFVRISMIAKDGKLVHLDLVCKPQMDGLWKFFKNLDELKSFINNNTEEALKKAIYKTDDGNYILNCEIGSGELIINREKWEKVQGEKINIFMPIVQEFMAVALSGGIDT